MLLVLRAVWTPSHADPTRLPGAGAGAAVPAIAGGTTTGPATSVSPGASVTASTSATPSPTPTPSGSGSPQAPASLAPSTGAPTPSPAPTTAGPTVTYQAESASISLGSVATTRAGYSGSGYVLYGDVNGAYVQWTVTGVAGTASLTIRYGNNSGDSKPTSVTVNGVVQVGRVSYSTQTGTGWGTRTVTVTLVDGSNTIRISATSNDGGPDIDYISLAQ